MNNHKKQDNIFLKKDSFEENNFFLRKSENIYQYQTNVSGRHLNDYDSNILQDDAYKNLKNELLKLEYQILKIEKELHIIDEQIIIAKEINDYATIDWLAQRRNLLKNDLEQISQLYNKTSLSAKLSDEITNIVSPEFKQIKFIKTFCNKLKSLLPKDFKSLFELKGTLKKLEAIHKNIDELMSSSAPYGEINNRYEQISKYITKANNIQAQIYKDLRKTKQ